MSRQNVIQGCEAVTPPLLKKRMKRHLLFALSSLCLLLCAQCSSSAPVESAPAAAEQDSAAPLVLLDIGHSPRSGGACTPDKKVNENTFWYQYAPVIQAELVQAGYRCELVNRGEAPTREPAKSLAQKHGVKQLNDKDTGKRYPSKFHPKWIGAGMVSADYGITRRPACMVFLHLNSTGESWTSGTPAGLVISDGNVGNALAQSVCDAVTAEMGQEMGGGKCRILVRNRPEQKGGGWVNALAEEGIPAVVTECLYTNSRTHYAILTDEAKATRFAEAVAHGIINWLQQKTEP